MKRFALLLALFPLLAFAACGGDPEPSAQTSTRPSVVADASAQPTLKPIGTSFPAGDAHVSIVSPKDGDTVKAGDVRVEASVEGFELVDKIGEEGKQGEGHVVYYLGSGYQAPMTKGQSAMAGGSGSFTSYPSAQTSYTWPNVQPGRQTLTVQLVNNDNTPLDPPQTAQVTVTVA